MYFQTRYLITYFYYYLRYNAIVYLSSLQKQLFSEHETFKSADDRIRFFAIKKEKLHLNKS